MKCFWCKRLHEDGKIEYTEIREADYVYGGDSMCEQHLDLIRHWGASVVLEKGMMTP